MPPVSTARITLPDRYQVVRHIANGGMAGVWEAHDELLDRAVAVKVLAQHLSDDERARKRFEREARAAAGLSSHPNVVTIYDVAEHDGPRVHRHGADARRVDRRRAAPRRGDRPPARAALAARGRLGRSTPPTRPASSTATSSPPTCCSTTTTASRIADFGIARLAWEDQVTQTGQVLGTAAYLAPEQAMGEPATAASDRYALPVVAFELLTGEKPFNAEHFAAQARAHVEDDPPRASELNPDLTDARRRRDRPRHGQGPRRPLGVRRRVRRAPRRVAGRAAAAPRREARCRPGRRDPPACSTAATARRRRPAPPRRRRRLGPRPAARAPAPAC